jgi:ribosomal protein S18 acetylase RimI-like enzyme
MDTLTFDDVRHHADLFELFSRVRADELGMHSWDPELRARMLRFQFDAQRHGYRAQCPAADARLILRGGVRVGWIIVDRSGPALHCVDIGIVPEARSQGVGTRVWRALQDEAAATARPLVLTVLRTNIRARALRAARVPRDRRD